MHVQILCEPQKITRTIARIIDQLEARRVMKHHFHDIGFCQNWTLYPHSRSYKWQSGVILNIEQYWQTTVHVGIATPIIYELLTISSQCHM